MNAMDVIHNPKLRNEFMRAVNIVVDVQLTMFRESPSPSREDVLSRFMSAYRAADNSTLTEDDIVGMVRASLADSLDAFNDPFANYVTPDALKMYKQRRGGRFVGIGMKYRARSDAYPVVIGPLLGGPLEHANIEPGDELRTIDGVDQFSATSKSVSSALKGKADSKVLLQLLREGTEELLSIEAHRQAVKLEYARSSMLDDGVGYIKISRFGGKTYEHVESLLRELLEKNAEAIVLDLRDNPGGSTKAARAVVSFFSNVAQVYAEQFKSGKTRLLPRIGEKITDLPLAILVNEKSMSSAEME